MKELQINLISSKLLTEYLTIVDTGIGIIKTGLINKSNTIVKSSIKAFMDT